VDFSVTVTVSLFGIYSSIVDASSTVTVGWPGTLLWDWLPGDGCYCDRAARG
jgi:hypothetical protein